LNISNITAKNVQINEEIRDKEVRLVGENGEQLGIVSSKDAQKMAFDKNLDLVKIAPTATPPVCKIMDYGKYCFEQVKREKEVRKNQKIVEIKEIRMFSAIDSHDFNTKVQHGIKFLENGDKLKVSVRFRKRAIAHPHLGQELLDKFSEACAEVGTVEKAAKMDGRTLIMFISPKNKK
jgi:translation initiation factor IF-3